MDGIPVKINEKYKPPPKITLPACILNRLNNVQFANYTYDFSLETTVTEHMTRLNKICQDAVDRFDAKVSPEQPDKTGAFSENNVGTAETSILTPVPISSCSAVSTSRKENIFKYSDFENDTSSPFDNEELKTLNDMEELAHVLGAASIGGQNPKTEESRAVQESWPRYGSPSQSHFYPNMCYNPISMSTSHPPNYSSHVPHSSYQSNLYLQSRMEPYPKSAEGQATAEQYMENTDVHSQAKQYATTPSVQSVVEAYATNPVVQPPSDVSARSGRNGENEEDGRVSDIVKSLEEYLGQRKTVENPRNPSGRPMPESPPSFFKLTDQQQKTARQIADMGFPLARAVCAVKQFGSDETKIIEYLLLVQSFIDKGYTESQTVHALELNQCDETQTENYLKVLSQIMKLGFKEEEVVNALAKTKNDRDKALDILIR